MAEPLGRGVPEELVTKSVDLPSGELRLLQPEESAELPDSGPVEWAPIAPYWSVLWRSGVALASELDGKPLCGLHVVELGCGLAVPSIAAARAGATALAILWFVAGYAFYSCLFACAGALVPRQEELQSTTMPLTLLILVSFLVSFAVARSTTAASAAEISGRRRWTSGSGSRTCFIATATWVSAWKGASPVSIS